MDKHLEQIYKTRSYIQRYGMDNYITRYMNDNNIHFCDIEEVTSSLNGEIAKFSIEQPKPFFNTLTGKDKPSLLERRIK